MHYQDFQADAEQRQFDRLVGQVDLLGTIRYLAGLKNAPDMGATFELSQEIAKRTGRRANGVFIPHVALMRRDLTVGTASAGGHTVQTTLRGFVDMLRPRAKVLQAGATLLPGLVGNVAIPRQTAAATAYWVSESEAPTESQQAFDQIAMSPKTVAAFTDMSRKLLLQSSIDVQNFVGQDLTASIALAIDGAALNGAGGTQPTGLLGTAGVLSQTIAGSAPTWAEVVNMETKVAAESADEPTSAFLMTPAVRGSLNKTEKVADTGEFIWDNTRIDGADGRLAGYRAFVSSNVPQNLGAGTNEHAMIFGNWSDLVVGLWGVLDLMVDPYTGSTTGAVRVIAMQDVDVAVRHAQSFCKAQYAPA